MPSAQNIMENHKTKRMSSALKFLTHYAVQSRPHTQWFPLVSPPKKNILLKKKFDDDDEVQKVMTWFKGQAADFNDSGDAEAGSKTW
jgi:hypothetical protein